MWSWYLTHLIFVTFNNNQPLKLLVIHFSYYFSVPITFILTRDNPNLNIYLMPVSNSEIYSAGILSSEVYSISIAEVRWTRKCTLVRCRGQSVSSSPLHIKLQPCFCTLRATRPTLAREPENKYRRELCKMRRDILITSITTPNYSSLICRGKFKA